MFLSAQSFAVSKSWFEPRDFTLSNVKLDDLFDYISENSGVTIEYSVEVADRYVPSLRAKQKSPSQIMNVISEAYELSMLPTSKGGFRIEVRKPTHLKKLAVNDSDVKIDVNFSDASTAEILSYLDSVKPGLDVLHYDGFKQRHRFKGSYSAAEIINDLAEAEGLNVISSDGIIYFK
jgi:hypothetical protein